MHGTLQPVYALQQLADKILDAIKPIVDVVEAALNCRALGHYRQVVAESHLLPDGFEALGDDVEVGLLCGHDGVVVLLRQQCFS